MSSDQDKEVEAMQKWTTGGGFQSTRVSCIRGIRAGYVAQ